MENNSNTTNFSKIYKNTYWGDFKYKEENKEIIDNRNNFITDYNIKKNVRDTVPQRIKKGLKVLEGKSYHDHMEYYYTHDKHYVIISSSYSKDSEEVDLFFHKEGFSKLYDLYHKSAITYVSVRF